jgi:hypothetical protein
MSENINSRIAKVILYSTAINYDSAEADDDIIQAMIKLGNSGLRRLKYSGPTHNVGEIIHYIKFIEREIEK